MPLTMRSITEPITIAVNLSLSLTLKYKRKAHYENICAIDVNLNNFLLYFLYTNVDDIMCV